MLVKMCSALCECVPSFQKFLITFRKIIIFLPCDVSSIGKGISVPVLCGNLLLDTWCSKQGGLSCLCTLLFGAHRLNNWALIGHCNISILRKWKALHVFELLWIFVIVHLAQICSRCSMDGAYRLSLKATLGNESHAACQSGLAAPLMLLSNTCWSGKYESPIVWFSSYSVIKGWHLVEWLARTLALQSQLSGSWFGRLG